MARYVTLRAEGDDGWPVTEEHPTADRDEVAGAVNEDYAETRPVMVPQTVPVMVPQLTEASVVTEHPDGSRTTETYQRATGAMVPSPDGATEETGLMVPDPSGATEETGVTLTREVDPGGHLCVYAGDQLLKQYEPGEWRSCSAEPPHWLAEPVTP